VSPGDDETVTIFVNPSDSTGCLIQVDRGNSSSRTTHVLDKSRLPREQSRLRIQFDVPSSVGSANWTASEGAQRDLAEAGFRTELSPGDDYPIHDGQAV